MHKIPGRAPIAAAILTAALLPLAVMILFAILTARDALKEQVFQTAVREGRGTALAVAEDLQGKHELVTLFATRRLLRDATAQRARALAERHLRDIADVIPDFERAVVTDPAGTLWAHYPATDESVVGRNFASREWYQGVTRRKNTYLTGVYERAAKPAHLVYAFATPIYDLQNRLAGYLVVQDNGERLGKQLDRLASLSGGGTAVVDHNGRRVLEIGAHTLPGEEDMRAKDPCVNSALRGEETVETHVHDGAEYISVCTQVPDTGWATVTHIPLATALAPVRTIAWQMAAGGLVLLAVAGGLAGFWANTFARNRLLLAETARLKQETETQRNRYWSLLDSSSDGLGMATNDRTLLFINRAFARLFDQPSLSDLVGRPVADVRPRLFPLLAQPEKYQAEMERVWQEPEIAHDFEMNLNDGRAYHFYTFPVRNDAGEIIGRSLVCRDVTREREVDRMKSEFVATVSHELRTPLASLLGFSELMLTRALPEEKHRQFLEVIHKESKRLNALVNDFLDLQRIESGRVSYTLEQLNIASLAREVAALFSSDAKHPLTLDLPEGLPPVVGDHDRIKQVLQNLLSNAVKFSPRGGEIVVAARATGDGMVEIAVSDHGLGIPEAAMPRLFGKFYRVDSSDRREIGGTGLGLALCKEIVTAHRGRIWAESRPGEGSTFRFTLPLAEAVPALAAAPAAFDALVVEDDAAFATLMREHLGEAGLCTHIEASVEGALEALRANRPRIILLDIHLAGKMDGWDLLVALKSDPRLAPIPVIVTTVTDKKSRGLALGASDYLVKPFPMETLCATVRRHLPRTQGGTVLVVDDDATFRTALGETLRADLGCRVIEAGGGSEALAKIEEQTPDLVLLDLLMPGMDGFEVLNRLRLDKRTARLPVLVVTGKDLTAADKERLRHGMARVLTKAEYRRERLLALVQELLGSKAS